MTSSFLFRTACLLAFLAVAFGAFGAHALKELLRRHDMAQVWQTAVFYHLVHAVALLFLSRGNPIPQGPILLFLAGILLFSGSLYLLAITNFRMLGAVTPVGGVALLIGWAWLAWTGRS